MRKAYRLAAVVWVFALIMALGNAEAAWHGGLWHWNSSDLDGSNSLQNAADEFDGRIDTIEAGGTASQYPSLISNVVLVIHGQRIILSGSISNIVGTLDTSNVVIRGSFTCPADAVSIDALNGITVSGSQLNAAGNGTTATLTPTILSNVVAWIEGSNVVIRGSFTAPADAISLDALNGITVSASQLNAAGNGTTQTLTPTIMSNVVAWIEGSNVVIRGSFTAPADAISLDALNGITVSASQLNAAGNGTTETLTPSLITNQVGKVGVSNIVVVAGGSLQLNTGASLTLPAGAIGVTTVSSNTFLGMASNSMPVVSILGTNYYIMRAP